MAKLFANRFDLDQLPDPKKPNQNIEQGSTTVDRNNNESLITDPRTRVEPVQPIDINTQRLNARFRDIDSQKNAMSTSDEILESQGVRKSAAEQYVSRTKVEPFGTKPVEQGTANIKLPAEVEGRTSPVDIRKVDQGSQITDPKIEISKIDQGSKITNPKTVVQKIEAGDRIVNPNTLIKLVNADEKIVNPNIEVQRVKDGDRIVNPNTPIKPVDQNEFIVNPNTVINRIVEGDRIVNPNTVINKIAVGDRITDPKIVINPIKSGDRITDPKIKVVKVTADELIVNPNIQTQPTSPVTQPTVPLYGGIGVTKLFPRTISLKDRLQQGDLGTTRHLPEYILSDQNTGYITIKNPAVIEKVTRITAQRVVYQNTILKQGGVEKLLEGIVSFINPIKYGERKVNQGSITIKNNIRELKKPSPITIKKVVPGSMITDPRTIINKVIPGERTTDPNTKIKPIEAGDRIVDPKTPINLVNPNELIVNPDIQITPVKAGERTVDPDTKITKVAPGERTIDPKIDIKVVKPGERTVNPKTKVDKVKPGSRTFDPKTRVAKVKPGERTVDPKLKINPVRPGSRTFDPRTRINPIRPGSRTYIPYIPIFPFLETDDKLFYTQEPIILENNFDTFPSDGTVPLNGTISPFEPGPEVILPGEETPQGSAQPVWIDQTGLTYINQYNRVYRYSVDDTRSYLKDAADRGTAPPLLSKVYDVASSTVIENKEVLFPPAINGDYTLPGGYRTLNYSQIQRRGATNNRRNLDFTYDDGPGALAPWRQRLGMPDQGADTINSSVSSTARDFVTLKLQSGRDGSVLQFRSYIKAFSDNFTAQYTDVNYVGRPDTLKVFKGTTRQLGLGFIVPALSEDDLETIYQKLNKLVQTATMGRPDGSYMQGPFMKLTVGGWCKGLPIIVNSLKYETNPAEYSWDIQHEVPHLVDVSMDCVALSDNTGTSPFLSTGTYITYGA